MNAKDTLDRDQVIDFVQKCQDKKTGGFGGNVNHDPHLLYTLSAVQILVIEDALDAIDVEKVVECMFSFLIQVYTKRHC